ncbi:hypothetical protein L1887_55069 [Cichorium endivia]|nr:hypothetical protein L1887_55069 [Cichorium endivia]
MWAPTGCWRALSQAKHERGCQSLHRHGAVGGSSGRHVRLAEARLTSCGLQSFDNHRPSVGKSRPMHGLKPRPRPAQAVLQLHRSAGVLMPSLAVMLGGTASSADLGGSSKYSSENFED